MATLVLGTVGRAIGGPVGGIIGTAVGGFVDRGLFGGAAPRGRDLAVQSAAYGEPIGAVTGTLRAAGTLIWSSGIDERRQAGGFAYTASFAVGLSARPVERIGRIWADGVLIRDGDGVFSLPVTMRLHGGGEGQAVDPLIAAAEGVGGTPAYRGLAYAVFEDLPLDSFGNRIPGLSFEIVAAPVATMGDVMVALAGHGELPLLVVGDFPVLSGYFAGAAGNLAEVLEPLLAVSGASLQVDGAGLTVRGAGGAVRVIASDDRDAVMPGAGRDRDRQRLAVAAEDALQIGFIDSSRDYLAGLQQARRGNGSRVVTRGLAAAMTPVAAKQLAVDSLARRHAGRMTRALRLPWRHLGVVPGDRLVLGDETTVWRVREQRFEAFVVTLALEREAAAADAVASADGGRVLQFADGPPGPTQLLVLETPGLADGDAATTPQIWAAAAGGRYWRRAAIEISRDEGVSYQWLGDVVGGAVLGVAATVAWSGPVGVWDDGPGFEVMLHNPAMVLESRPDAAVLAGANLAMLGDELVQFGVAEHLAPGRFRLRRLLRGRLGTEVHVAGHEIGERFVLLDSAALLAVPNGVAGQQVRLRAAGVDDGAAEPVAAIVTGQALRPLSPAHLRLVESGGDVAATWIRRSRGGFCWADFVDAPLAEADERYRVEIRLDGRLVRMLEVGVPRAVYTAAERLADGGGAVVTMAVAQISAAVGPGDVAMASL